MLPVSGAALIVGQPTGADELFVLETDVAPAAIMTELCFRVVRRVGGAPIDWLRLPAVDLDAAVLVLRRAWIGERISSDVACPGPGCGERIDVSFTVGDYLDHHRPRPTRQAVADAAPGWFTLARTAVRFRIPTLDDIAAAEADVAPARALTERCVEAPELSRAVARRLDRALSALAPRLDGALGGVCPLCGHAVTMRFDPTPYTLAELRHAFSGLYADVHAIASDYGWSEADILALPRSRRRRYAAIALGGRIAA